MARMPDNFIDLTVTSPPYDNLREYKGYSFPFEEIANELYRVTKKGGVVVWIVGDATNNGSERPEDWRWRVWFLRRWVGCGIRFSRSINSSGPVRMSWWRVDTVCCSWRRSSGWWMSEGIGDGHFRLSWWEVTPSLRMRSRGSSLTVRLPTGWGEALLPNGLVPGPNSIFSHSRIWFPGLCFIGSGNAKYSSNSNLCYFESSTEQLWAAPWILLWGYSGGE